MPAAWRITKRRYASSALDGEGAFQHGGRWSDRGTLVVYVSETRALAALELVAHLPANAPLHAYVLIGAEIPDDLVLAVDQSILPPDWFEYPAPPVLRRIGDQWANSGDSVVLAVPSALVRQEHNYLINPGHPDFDRISIGDPETFRIDPRIR